jgi:asparagine synthase (glutamine-hydrolysing)
MCGIAGIVRKDEGRIDPQWLKEMAAKMIHRGPDGEGTWYDSHVGLVHRRLAIIDLQTGEQPMSNEDGSVWAVFNGEIYNFRELRAQLESNGHLFRTKSDTEVLLHGYEAWGKDLLAKLNGMFAFAVWDHRHRKLFMARDRLGVKPLYYHDGDGLFAFASELQGLTGCPVVPQELDPRALELYLHYQYIPSPFTIYRGVRKLEPSHWLEVDLEKRAVRSGPYWEIDAGREPDRSKTMNQWLELLDGLVTDAVRIRLTSDVRFGAFLSGGTDSGLMVALMSRLLGEPVNTFSIGLEGEAKDELRSAAQIAQRFQTTHVEFKVSPEELEIVPEMCRHFGEPFADSSAIPTYYVSKMAASKVKMALSGDGGDEFFGGYLTYPALLKAKRLDFLIGSHMKRAACLSPSRRLSWRMRFIGSNWQNRHDMMMSHFSLDERKRLLSGQPIFSDGEYLSRTFPTRWKDPVLNAQYLDMRTYLPDDILVKVDRMSMANSIEVRSPLLDYRIAETAFSIPTNLKIPRWSRDNVYGKFILKELASNYLGKEYVYQPKRGFGIPIDRWLREDRRGYMADTLLSSSSPVHDYLDGSLILSLAQEHRSGRFNHCAKLWNLLMLDGWLRYVSRDHGRQQEQKNAA